MLCRYTKARFKGKDVFLAYTVGALFRINDLLEEGEDLMMLLEGNDARGLERFCSAIAILAECGSQVRQSEGSPPTYAPDAKELLACMQPVEYINLKQEAVNAILLGYGREIINTEEEIDLDLANLEKK